MKKKDILSRIKFAYKTFFNIGIIFFLLNFSTAAFSQNKNLLLGVNAGSTITLTNYSSYKPGIYLNSELSIPSKHKEDAVTADVSFHSFKNKRISSDVVKLMDLKVGYRFSPSASTPIYFHPSLGLSIFVDDPGGNTNIAAGVGLGYLPKVGNGHLNIFAEYNSIGFSQNLSLLNLGVGYLFRLK